MHVYLSNKLKLLHYFTQVNSDGKVIYEIKKKHFIDNNRKNIDSVFI